MCIGNRDYNVKNGAFGDLVCIGNGFKEAEFVGSQGAYLDFMENKFGTSIGNYFRKIYNLNVEGQISYTFYGWQF